MIARMLAQYGISRALASAGTGGWDLSSATFNQSSGGIDNITDTNALEGIYISDDGINVYLVSTKNEEAMHIVMGTPWDISTLVNGSGDLALGDGVVGSGNMLERDPTGIDFKPDGTQLYAWSSFTDTLATWTLSTPWNLTTASYVKKVDTTAYGAIRGGRIKNDGTKLFYVDITNGVIHEFNLGTPWDIATASLVNSESIAAVESGPEGMFVSPDGTRIYVANAAAVSEFILGTPWDTTTMTHNYTFDTSAQTTDINDVFFKPDGTKMYIINTVAPYHIFEYDLTVINTGPVASGITLSIDSPTQGQEFTE